MSEQFSILIDSHSRFETGEPGGAWLAMPATQEQLHAAMQSVGITADNPQDFFINGFANTEDCPFDVPLAVIQSGSVDELNYLAALLSMQRDEDKGKFVAAVTLGEYAGNLKDLINLVQNLDCYWLYSTVQSEEDYGYYLVNELEEPELPEEAKKYFMYEEYGRDAAINDGGRFTEQGYIYNNKNTFTEWYDGRDVPEEYRVMSYPQPPTRPNPEKADMDATPAAQTAQPAAEQPQPRPVIPIVLNAEKPAEKMKEITDRLEQGISELFESDRYKEYLSVMSKFHSYSFNNTLLIAMQKPDASHVAGFSAWRNEFERNVRKGEKGIRIIAPSPFKVKKEMEKIDPKTQKPLIGKNGKPVTEEQEITIPAFKVVSVFDVSQTEGKELPDIAVDTLTGDVEQYKDFFAALEKTSPVPVGFEKIEGAHGYYHLEEKRIAIDEGMSELQTIKTAIHEIAHAKLHDVDLTIPKEQQNRPDSRTREVEAESIAYAVCQHYGLDTSDYSFGYVAGWSSGKELAELKSSLETIRSTAATLIDTIDRHFAEIQKVQGKVQEQPAPEQAAAQETPVFDKLPPEQQAELSDTVRDTLQFLIDADIQAHGEVTGGTLEAIAAQGYFYKDGQLEKQRNAPEQPQSEVDELPAAAPQEAPAPETQPAAVTYYPINETAARRAKDANSYSDYKPGSATAEYRSYVDEAVKIAERQKARVDPMYHEKIDSLLDAYARKLAANMNSRFSIDARVPSILIAGGSNFPVRKKEKQNAARDSNYREWQDIQGLLDKIRSTGMGGISADDPQAVQKLESKLTDLQQSQETMKAVNAYYRKHKTLDGCTLMSPENIEKLKASMSRSYYQNPKPFETWALSNNNAEIHRVKTRIEELKHREETPLTGWEFDGGRVEANKEENRLQVFFDEKPDEEKRTELKKGGFRWSPTAGAWQRQLNGNAFYAANDIKCIQPITGERPTDLQRAHSKAQQAKPQEQPASEQTAEPDKDTFTIYQLKRGDETRDFRFEPYDRLQATGHTVDPANYDLIYTAPLTPDMTLESIWEKFNIDHPKDFKGHSLSVSDVVVLHQDGQDAAHYVDSIGYQQVPEFLQPQQTELIPDNFLTGEKIKTPRGTFSLTDMTHEQMKEAGYGFHHQSDDGKYHIMANGTLAFAIAAEQPEKVNPLKHVEDTVEQNDNSFDGIINNTPTVDELEAKAKAGEQISLSDLAAAIKTDKERGKAAKPEEKPSIRAQLKADKERAAQKKSKAKTQDLERS